ncbi:arsenical pump-driving ATPase [Rhodohalobacter barkolensis]|uniref:arsenite-transporting ATPase n=1 Tax=Rhodohalobacter barkolensis TaxID=2053187 RepID=A0A2N0VLS2_9BACT|nr:arsenical pump-driving ATPase [Rhodohalobacter barkolensis]PKD45091.1 arsenical pump-driving ATPase [Rhodohalobacter barkolensis]
MLPEITPYIFFTGKGGVGKTSLASATAVKLADEGKSVLLISTDPASNLKEVLETNVTEKITPIDGVENLHAVNIDPELSAEEYRKRVTSPMEGILPEEEINKIREELSGACTTEIAAFDEFARYVAGDGENQPYDVIVFDTAPTGHTLRLLELPAAWSEFIESNPDGASCIGPSSALKTSQARYQKVVDRLKDKDATTIYLVTRPDGSALREADRSGLELKEMGLANQLLLINGYFEPVDVSDLFAQKMKEMADHTLENMPDRLKEMKQITFPLRPYNLLGIEKLRKVFEPLDKDEIKNNSGSILTEDYESDFPGLEDMVEDIIDDKDHGLVMTMGKGGVGKTTVAAAIALRLAQKGYPVHLTTTDPAAHLMDHLGDMKLPENLEVNRIDPHSEKKAYIEKVLKQKGNNKTEEELKLLKEDLESPCTEEVAVFQAFSKAIHQAKRKFVVVDTAPTGHTLLLLDTTGSYHREVLRNTAMDADKFKTPYMFLQDSDYAKLIIVSLPETTPITEAAKLQDDLRRSGIEPYAWVANQSMSATNISDPLLKQRAAAEVPLLDEIDKSHAKKLYAIPWISEHHVLQTLISKQKKDVIA